MRASRHRLAALAAGAVLASVPAAAGETDATPPPSLLLVTLDTTRADHLGCYGAKDARTTTLDRLAREGTLFERALSPTPLTLPSHATILTGRPPHRHGVRDNALFRLGSAEVTLTERLAEEGYATAAVVGAAVLDRVTGIGQGFDHYDDHVRVGPPEWFRWEERAAGMVTDAALERVEDLAEPFFLWVHYYDPHLPYVPPEPYRKAFAERLYDGEIAYMDGELGRLLEAIEARPVAGGVVVAVAGDHGESLGEHGEEGHSVFVYQATQSVPLILRGPGVPAGRRVAGNVGLVDLAPTLLDLLGQPALEQSAGRSLAPLLRGKRPGSDPGYVMESRFPYLAYGWSSLEALVEGDLKLIDAPEPELYDLERDPHETRNLAGERRATIRAMRGRLLERLHVEDAAPVIPPAPDADAAQQLDRLLALGYVGGTMAPGGVHDPEEATEGLGQISGLPDPKKMIHLVGELDRARRLVSSGESRAAAEALERILAASPGNLPALLALGTARRNTGEIGKAIAVHRRAVERNPAWHMTHFNLAVTLSAAGDEHRVEAERTFGRALALQERHAESYRGLAELLIGERRIEAARDVLQSAAANGVSDAALLLLQGTVEASLGDLEAADRSFAAALAHDPTLARAHEGRGKIAFLRGDPRRAAEEYREALRTRPDPATARTLGSILLNELGDVAGAREAFALALSLEPDGPDAPVVREMLRVLEGGEPEVEVEIRQRPVDEP